MHAVQLVAAAPLEFILDNIEKTAMETLDKRQRFQIEPADLVFDRNGNTFPNQLCCNSHLTPHKLTLRSVDRICEPMRQRLREISEKRFNQ
ncbi:hypothetical protein CHELA1G2_12379 [Hyphomicrobiales bacterium]|nr:hypothetical protein CHELA1G2_12379 [Hyphomicrobiales bacterium]